MQRLKYLLQKEFIQIRRNTFIARAIVMIPVAQMLVLVPVVTFDIRHIDLCVVDQDLSPLSRQLVTKLQGATFSESTRPRSPSGKQRMPWMQVKRTSS